MKKIISTIFPYFLIFAAHLDRPIDPDLGWHLKYGEYFFQHHALLEKNIFSTEMPTYHYINSAWGTDLITYGVFHYFGFLGISILGAVICTLLFYAIAKTTHISFFEALVFFPLLYFFLYPITGASFRGQIFSLLGINILFYLIAQFEREKEKAILFTIPLFFLWVNLHGEFVLGLGILVLWSLFFLCRLYVNKKTKRIKQALRTRLLIYTTLICTCAVTLLNPYSMHIYTETLRHFNNPLRTEILEWSPIKIFSQFWVAMILWGLLLVLGVGIVIWQKKLRKNLFLLFVSLVLFGISFQVRRYMWPMFIISSPFVVILIKGLHEQTKRVFFSMTLIVCSLFIIAIFMIKLPRRNITSMNWKTYCQKMYCSPQAADFLVKKRLSGRVFSLYDWGGWLIWNYPQIKPGIDGRMVFWKDDQGYSAYVEYLQIFYSLHDINASSYDIAFIPNGTSLAWHLAFLAKQRKWKLIYYDPLAVIFIRQR